MPMRRRRTDTATPDRLRLNAEELDLEDQRRVRRDLRRVSALAVGEIARDRQAAKSAHAHADETFFPALDHLVGADLEDERRASGLSRAVELAAVRERADVLHGDAIAGTHGVAGSGAEI